MSSKKKTFQSRQQLRRRRGIPPRVEILPSERLIRDVEGMLDRCKELFEFIEERLPIGRPREMTLRQLFLALMVVMRIRQRLHLTDIDDLILTAPPELRRRLGLIRADGNPYTYRQYWGFFHLVVESLDPTGTSFRDQRPTKKNPHKQPKTFTDEETNEREAALQHVFHLICKASIPTWMRHDSGDYVGDGTTKWAYSRPQFDFMQRPPGNDRGDVVTIADLVEDDTLEEAGFDDDDHPERKPRTVASRHDPDATYLGRKPPKHVFGYMLHLLVRVEHNMPLLIETGRLTAVTADPARSLLPVIARLAHDRANDPTLKAGIAAGTARKLGDIGTDCGYSQANPLNWHLPIRALGGNPIYRLHSQNQAGIHNRHPKVPFCDGEPVCECCIGHDLTKIRYPRPGAGDDLHLQFQRDVEQRFKLFGYRSNGDVRADGSRHLLAPHYDSDRPGGPGGCEFCVDAAGNAIIDAKTKQPKTRCCTKNGYVFTAEQLAWAQYPRYGTPSWRDRNVLRNRVEGANSLVKNTDIVRWGKQDSHHYRGRAFESIIAALAIAIVNLEQLENWEIVELDTKPNRGGRPRNPGLEQYLPATPTVATHAHSPP